MTEQKKNTSGRRVIILLLILLAVAVVWVLTYPVDTFPLAATESAAVGALKSIQAAEALWKSNGRAATGKSDYWTYDVSGLYRMLKDGRPMADIMLNLAKADGRPHKDGLFGNQVTENWEAVKSELGPKSGYLYLAIERDETGAPYNQIEFKGVKAFNESKFAFVAYPVQQGKTGTRTFIINESGIIYARVNKSDADKIILQWPAEELKNAKDNPAREGLWHTIE